MKKNHQIATWQDRMVFMSYKMKSYEIPSCLDLMQEEINELRELLNTYEFVLYPPPKNEQLSFDL